MTTNGRAIIFTTIVFMVGLIMILFVIQAKAERAWPESEWRTKHVVKSYKPRRHIKRHKIAPRRHRKPRVKAWRRATVTRSTIATGCKDTVRITGKQFATLPGAKARADKAWGGQVRFRHGERYSDINNARNKLYQCVNSSVENIVNRATEKIGFNSRLKRCEVWAQPCIAPVVK